MQINFTVDTSTFLDKFLYVISALNPPNKQLTHTEVIVLREFLLLPSKFQYQRFSSAARSKIILNLKERGIKFSKANLNNRIYDLLEKGYLKRDEDNVLYISKYILKALEHFNNSSELELKINFKK